VAVDSTHLYFGINDQTDSYVESVNLQGEESVLRPVADSVIRGLALDSGHLYWADQREGGTIGRIDLGLSLAGMEKAFLDVGGQPVGLAVSGDHLVWSNNGEARPNPGSDLYRFTAQGTAGCQEARGCLADLTADPTDEDGAEVRGVLGTSPDGSYVYLVANADLDGSGEAEPGDCTGEEFSQQSGECDIYLLHEGSFSFVARVRTTSGPDTDANNWVPFPWGLSGSSTYDPRSSIVSADGRTLVYLSRGRLYRYTAGVGSTCVSCDPTGGEEGQTSYFGSLTYPNLRPTHVGVGSVQGHFASADGNRVFFESTAALVASDTDGEGGCPTVRVSQATGAPSCLDVYEWEAPGTGSCTEGGPAYSPRDGGCLYLISVGTESEPAFLADASSSGDDVFFFTRSRLVGQDTDGMRDVYDARVDGGLASQNPRPTPTCEAEGCRPAATPAPGFTAPPRFSGPGNPKAPSCKKGKVPRKGKCVKKAPKRCKKGKVRRKGRCVKKKAAHGKHHTNGHRHGQGRHGGR
jgi:hypothetical protein